MSFFMKPDNHVLEEKNGKSAILPIITGIITVAGLLLKKKNHSADNPLLNGGDPEKYIHY